MAVDISPGLAKVHLDALALILGGEDEDDFVQKRWRVDVVQTRKVERREEVDRPLDDRVREKVLTLIWEGRPKEARDFLVKIGKKVAVVLLEVDRLRICIFFVHLRAIWRLEGGEERRESARFLCERGRGRFREGGEEGGVEVEESEGDQR